MNSIPKWHEHLVHHPCYAQINNLENLKIFMQFHVFAVWDFMSLLKRLQRDLTCVSLPWMPSPYPDTVVRLINEIVLGEESDIDENGAPLSHFKMYLNAMDEVGASVADIKQCLETLDFSKQNPAIQNFVNFHLQLAQHGSIEEVAGAFFWGREKLLPDVFTSIVTVIENSELECPNLTYYFKRHIQLDGEEHGPMSLKCLDILCSDRAELKAQAEQAALHSLALRNELWNGALAQMSKDSLLAVNP